MRQGACVAVAAAFSFGLVGQAARADTMVIGGGLAEACSKGAVAAVRAAPLRTQRSKTEPTGAMDACDRALAEEPLSKRDLAATYVNRGVLLMGRSAYGAAQADFDMAVRIKPDLAEAHVNRGGAMVAQGQFREGIDALTLGLSLAPEEPEKAYFNRAIAHEALQDPRAAYLDYLKAAELSPGWPAPQGELGRFTVTRR